MAVFSRARRFREVEVVTRNYSVYPTPVGSRQSAVRGPGRQSAGGGRGRQSASTPNSATATPARSCVWYACGGSPNARANARATWNRLRRLTGEIVQSISTRTHAAKRVSSSSADASSRNASYRRATAAYARGVAVVPGSSAGRRRAGRQHPRQPQLRRARLRRRLTPLRAAAHRARRPVGTGPGQCRETGSTQLHCAFKA